MRVKKRQKRDIKMTILDLPKDILTYKIMYQLGHKTELWRIYHVCKYFRECVKPLLIQINHVIKIPGPWPMPERIPQWQKQITTITVDHPMYDSQLRELVQMFPNINNLFQECF